MKNVLVLGGGISGLTASYYLLKRLPNVKVTLIEGSKRLGGWIKSEKINDLVLEFGPRTMRTYGPSATTSLKLVEDLNIQKLLVGVKSNDIRCANRYIFYKNQLHKLPSKFASIFMSNSLTKKPLIYYIMREILKFKENCEADSSIYYFCNKLFGQELTELFIDPLVKGIYGGDINLLSIKSCFPSLYNYKINYKSVVLGSLLSPSHITSQKFKLFDEVKAHAWSIWYMKNGLQTLVDTLKLQLIANKNFNLITNNPITSVICSSPPLPIKIGLHNGETCQGDHVIAALPSHTLSKVLKDSNMPVVNKIAHELSGIHFCDIIVVNLIYEIASAQELSSLPFGFGYLVPSKENSLLLGTIFDWCLRYNPQENISCYPKLINFTCMLGGGQTQNLSHLDSTDEDKFAEIAKKSISYHLGLKRSPKSCIVSLLKNAIPQYYVGHSDRLKRIYGLIKDSGQPFSLIGSSYEGVSVNDCIHSAKACVDRLQHHATT